jgi:hypothetical protein
MSSARTVVVAAALTVAACGSSSDSPSGPVASTPMRGTLSGTEFVAVSARARKSATKPDRKTIDIFPSAVGCIGSAAGPLRYLTLSVPWQSGFTADFALGSFVGSFVTEEEKAHVTFTVSDTGRIEVLEAPSVVGEKARIRLRMSDDRNDFVEGEIAVDVCE